MDQTLPSGGLAQRAPPGAPLPPGRGGHHLEAGGGGRPHHLHDHGLHHLCQPEPGQHHRHALRGGGDGDHLLRRLRHPSDGLPHRLPLRPGARHGLERLLRLHGGRLHGHSLANGPGGGLPFGRRFRHPHPEPGAGDDHRRGPHDPEEGHWRGHWPLHRPHRPEQPGHRGGQPRHHGRPGHPGGPHTLLAIIGLAVTGLLLARRVPAPSWWGFW